MASSLNDHMIDVESDDEYTLESYDYEMVEENTEDSQSEHYNKRLGSVSVETVEDDDDDEYTYEEEFLSVVMEDDMDSTMEPPPLPGHRTNGPRNSPSPSIPKPSIPPTPIPAKVPISPITQTSPIAPIYGLKEPPNILTPSKQRSKDASSAGLSELSKQLRVLQANNEAKNVDINRMETQLRILAELKGISVGDLRNALDDACASEAFGELQNRVSKLKYELEAATLLKRERMRKDGAAPHIANLELRVGELEEVEEKQMKYIQDLYEALRQEKSRSTRFESENQQLKGALQDMIHRVQSETARAAQAETNFQKQLQEKREHQSKMKQKGDGIISSEMAAEYKQMVRLLKKKDEELRNVNARLHANEIRHGEKLKDAGDRSWQTQMEMKVKADKLAVTVKELEDADEQNGLRLAQYKARFTVQDERIIDSEQQLDSLYTAFDLLKEEFDSENDQRAAMQSNLNDADAEIARQAEKMEKKITKSHKHDHESRPPSIEHRGNSLPNYAHTPPSVATRSPIATRAPVSPMTPVTSRAHQSLTPYSNNMTDRTYDQTMTPLSNNSIDRRHSNYTVDYNESPTTYATARSFHPTPKRTPSTWELLRNNDNTNRPGIGDRHQTEGELICGSLIVESNGMLRKWKTRPSRIYLREEGYQWEIGEKRSFPLQFGITKVEFHPNHPLSFAVSLDPTSTNAPTIRAAATNEHDYHRWMTALYKATNGSDYQGGQGSDVLATPSSPSFSRGSLPNHASSGTRQPPSNDRFSHLLGPASNRFVPSASRVEEPRVPFASSSEEPEDADLKRILELSKYET